MSTINDISNNAAGFKVSDEELDTISRIAGFGNISSSMQNVLYGTNHYNHGHTPAVPNKDNSGYTFFTKPLLNLSQNNIKEDRRLAFLWNANPNSIGCAIRCMLSPYAADPRIPRDRSKENMALRASKLVDDSNPFIPLLGNTVLSLTGWPATTLETYTSSEGLVKEQWACADGRVSTYGVYDYTAEFANLRGDPITAMFITWLIYIEGVVTGVFDPYDELNIENEIDYQTRFYRLTMDEEDRYVTDIIAPAAAFPIGISDEIRANLSRNEAYGQQNTTISVPFKGIGVIKHDPALIKDFNDVHIMFNSSMADGKRERNMVPLKGQLKALRKIFNHQGYPRIEEDNELVFWIPKEKFTEELSILTGEDVSAKNVTDKILEAVL